MEVLRDVVANGDAWNSDNRILEVRRYSNPARGALKEAWGWLYTNGLVADDLEKNTSHYAFGVTRLGHRVASEGLDTHLG